jgi:hypothetical protein
MLCSFLSVSHSAKATDWTFLFVDTVGMQLQLPLDSSEQPQVQFIRRNMLLVRGALSIAVLSLVDADAAAPTIDCTKL